MPQRLKREEGIFCQTSIKSNELNNKKYFCTKTARYFVIGNSSTKTNSVWIVSHGYGQMEKEFVGDFKTLSNESTLVIAPEALNRFYIKEFNGKIALQVFR